MRSSLNSAIIKYNKIHCKIRFIEEVKAVYLQWFGYSSNRDFVEACNFALDLMVENGTDRLIADNQMAGVVSQENQEWLTEVWFPKAFDQGYRISAVIVSENELNNMSLHSIEQKLEKGKFLIRYFKNVRDASKWLNSL